MPVAPEVDEILDERTTGLIAESDWNARYEPLIAYYEQAGPDYEEWSRAFNMHFGYHRAGLNPFLREPMLHEMNRQVLQRLQLNPDSNGLLVDLGCGVGATVRCAASMFARARILGVTVVPWQVEKGNGWTHRLGILDRAHLELRDYTCTGLESDSVDGAYAIESSCHAEGPDKVAFIREAARILKPGARLVVADGFRKHPERPLGPITRRLYDALCRGFVLPELGQIEAFATALERNGFEEPAIEDISWRVAPSAIHAPFAVLWFRLKKKLRREPLSEYSRGNLRGAIVSALLGANRRQFGYYLVTATKGRIDG